MWCPTTVTPVAQAAGTRGDTANGVKTPQERLAQLIVGKLLVKTESEEAIAVLSHQVVRVVVEILKRGVARTVQRFHDEVPVRVEPMSASAESLVLLRSDSVPLRPEGLQIENKQLADNRNDLSVGLFLVRRWRAREAGIDPTILLEARVGALFVNDFGEQIAAGHLGVHSHEAADWRREGAR